MNSCLLSRRAFCFARYPRRRIALMFLYYGWEFDGLVVQANTKNTVEEHIFEALIRTKLIENRESTKLERCGRTDKGVSAFHQIATLNVRSTDASAEGIWWPVDSEPEQRINSTKELDYVKMLNSNLSPSIRIIAWSPIKNLEFSPRHDCVARSYKYFMPITNLNIEAITQAANLLIGSHDFRNFCKIDSNENRLMSSYIRTIHDIQLKPLTTQSDISDQFSLLEITIRGSSFLWHQIRYIVTLLFEIGRGNENPDLITELFDVEKYPGRPSYVLASETPLCLFDCNFKEDVELDWKYDVDELERVIIQLQMSWASLQTKASLIRSMIESLSPILSNQTAPKNALSSRGLEAFLISGINFKNLPRRFQKPYVPILKRKPCESLEIRRKKRGINMNNEELINGDDVDE